MSSPVFTRLSAEANKGEHRTNIKWNENPMRTNRTELLVLFAVRVRSEEK